MKTNFIFFIIIISLFSFACNKKNQQIKIMTDKSDKKTVALSINLSKSYPEKRIFMQDIANIEYIPLETRDNSIIGIVYEYAIYDSCIVVCNKSNNEILFFNRKGKFLSNFSRKGASGAEYTCISSWLYDPYSKEIYILDNLSGNRLLVYSKNGQIKYSTRYPLKQMFCSLFDYDENTIFGIKSNNIEIDNKDSGPNDYVFISKTDGSIKSKIMSIKKWVSTSFYSFKDNTTTVTSFPNKIICTDGNDFIISDPSSDTIFTLDGQKKINPFIIREPSIKNTKHPIIFETFFKNDKYLFGTTTTCNFEPNSKKKIEYIKSIGVNLDSHETFSPILYNSDAPESDYFPYLMQTYEQTIAPKNVWVLPMSILSLQKLLSKNQLNGKLKEIAEGLNIDDNPVLMLLNFK